MPTLPNPPFSVLLVLAKHAYPVKEVFLREREKVKGTQKGKDQRLVYEYLLARYCNIRGAGETVGELEDTLLDRLLAIFFIASFSPSPIKQLVSLGLSG